MWCLNRGIIVIILTIIIIMGGSTPWVPSLNLNFSLYPFTDVPVLSALFFAWKIAGGEF